MFEWQDYKKCDFGQGDIERLDFAVSGGEKANETARGCAAGEKGAARGCAAGANCVAQCAARESGVGEECAAGEKGAAQCAALQECAAGANGAANSADAVRASGSRADHDYYGRRRLYEALERIQISNLRLPTHFILFSLKHMREYNLYLGYAETDDIMAELLRIIESALLPGSVCGRWNASTVAVVLPNCTAEAARLWVHGIKTTAAKWRLAVALPGYLKMVSIEVVLAKSPPKLMTDLPRVAETALHEARLHDLRPEYIFLPRSEQPFAQSLILYLLGNKAVYLKEFTLCMLYYIELLAPDLGLSQQEMIELKLAALWQDTGLLAVPLGILVSPHPITVKQRRVLHDHVELSCQFAENFGVSPTVVALIRAHHERVDGLGYPHGLTAEHIPYGAKILKALGSFTLLRQELTWRSALGREGACRELLAGAGRAFDRRVVELICSRSEQMLSPEEVIFRYGLI